jgi:5-methylcytosine-specific restriction protein A
MGQGVGENKIARPEIEWRLEAVPGRELNQWSDEVTAALDEAASVPGDGPEVPEAKTGSSYVNLLKRIEGRGQPRRRDGVVRTDFSRSAAARQAVLVRSNGRCESARCTGMPAELNRRGEPILDVDHIMDLALGGDDHPINMVALCPNCHACKTRGADARRWRSELAKAVRAAHLGELH